MIKVNYYKDKGLITNKIYSIGEYSEDGLCLNGNWKVYRKNGKLRTIGQYRNKIIDGVWECYYPNGKTESLFDYRNGKMSEVVEYWSSGVLKSLRKYDNDENIIEEKIYDKNGILTSFNK